MPSPYRRPDHYAKKAKSDGFLARSVYKLEELDRRFRLTRRGGRAIDLGCYPGSWSRYLAIAGMNVVGVDYRAPELPGRFLVGSVLDVEPADLLGGGPADLVLSDMAPNTSGNRFTDHVRQVELARRALFIAGACLVRGGAFVVKVFDGEDAPAFQKEVSAAFVRVHRVKPEATRGRSVEFFLVGLGFRGEPSLP